MGMMKDAGNGIIVLVRLLFLLIAVAVCGLGMMYLPVAVLGIDKVDAVWKAMLCGSGVIGVIYYLAYIGKQR